MQRQHLASRDDGLRLQALAQIFFERLDRFRLRPIAFDDDGARFFDAKERFVDDVGANATGDRLSVLMSARNSAKGRTRRMDGRDGISRLCDERGTREDDFKPSREESTATTGECTRLWLQRYPAET